MESASNVDFSILTLEEIKSGVGGYSTDPAVIEYEPLRQFMTEVGEYFEAHNHQRYFSVPEVMKQFRPKFKQDTPYRAVIEKLENAGSAHFFMEGRSKRGERLEFEALLATMHTAQFMSSRASFEDMRRDTLLRLGAHYAAVPLLLAKNGEMPSYLSKKSQDESDYLDTEVTQAQEEDEKDYLPEAIDKAKGMDAEYIKTVRKNVKAQGDRLKGAGADRITAEVSWASVGMPQDVAEHLVAYIYYADQRIINEFNLRGGESLGYAFFEEALKKCEAYLTVYKDNLPDLPALYKAVKQVVERESR